MEQWTFGWTPGNPHSLPSRTNHPALLPKLMDSVIDYGSFGKLVEFWCRAMEGQPQPLVVDHLLQGT